MRDPLHCQIFGSLAVVTGGCGGLVCVAVVAPGTKGHTMSARHPCEVPPKSRMAAIAWAVGR